MSVAGDETLALSKRASDLYTESACKKTGISYARYTDQNNIDELALLFSLDAEFILAGRSFKGRRAIRSLFLMLQKKKNYISRHLVSNQWVQIAESGDIRGSSYITLYRLPKNGDNTAASVLPDVFAEYEDDYLISGDRCLIKRREINLVYVRQKDNNS